MGHMSGHMTGSDVKYASMHVSGGIHIKIELDSTFMVDCRY